MTEVTILPDDLYSTYYTSVSVYVPDMYYVDMDGDGEIDEGYFTVDPSTLTIDWDTLVLTGCQEDGSNSHRMPDIREKSEKKKKLKKFEKNC